MTSSDGQKESRNVNDYDNNSRGKIGYFGKKLNIYRHRENIYEMFFACVNVIVFAKSDSKNIR